MIKFDSVRQRDEAQIVGALLQVQGKAKEVFQRIESTGLIRSGIRESELNDAIYLLAEREFGITKHWHKRIVRAGKNTQLLFRDNPPDLVLTEDDIVFIDLGPVFDEWEADFGKTFVLGNDPKKLQLKRDVERAFATVKEYFSQHREVTGADLYAFACGEATRLGWEFGGIHAGHLIGKFSHAYIPGEKIHAYISSANKTTLCDLDSLGHVRHWILEIHLVDRVLGFGGFYEDILTI